MEYNGLGERLEMTSNTLVSTYTVDLLNGSRVLSATTAGLTTGYLYARGPLRTARRMTFNHSVIFSVE